MPQSPSQKVLSNFEGVPVGMPHIYTRRHKLTTNPPMSTLCPHSSLSSVPITRLPEPVPLFPDPGYSQTPNPQGAKAKLGSTQRWGRNPPWLEGSVPFCHPSSKPGLLCSVYHNSSHEEFLPHPTFSPLTTGVQNPSKGSVREQRPNQPLCPSPTKDLTLFL